MWRWYEKTSDNVVCVTTSVGGNVRVEGIQSGSRRYR
jgi:hypothetical protein